MNVKIFGFEWILGVPETDLSLADFLKHLRLQSGVPTADKKHVFAIQEKDGFLVGVVVGIKDYKRYCQLKERKVTARELEEGTTFVDVNFFLIHPNTGKGLYQLLPFNLG